MPTLCTVIIINFKFSNHKRPRVNDDQNSKGTNPFDLKLNNLFSCSDQTVQKRGHFGHFMDKSVQLKDNSGKIQKKIML